MSSGWRLDSLESWLWGLFGKTTTPVEALAWDDQQGSVAEGSGGAALTFAAFRDTPFKLAAFRNNQSDELHMSYQFPHQWKPTTSVRPHVHYVPLTNPASPEVVRFSGVYRWCLYGEEIPAVASWTAWSSDLTVSPGDGNKHLAFYIATVAPPANAAESGILLIYFKREGSHAADTYSGNLAVLSVDCHYQKAKLGTEQELAG